MKIRVTLTSLFVIEVTLGINNIDLLEEDRHTQTDRQTDRQTHRQTDTQTHRQTDTHVHGHGPRASTSIANLTSPSESGHWLPQPASLAITRVFFLTCPRT